MSHQIDPTRLLLLVVLLGAGMFVATRLVRPELGSTRHGAGPQRVAWRGMWGMTLLGVSSGVAGAFLEEQLGDSLLVRGLYGIYRVCWAPPFWLRELQEQLAGRGLQADVLGPLGLLLIPVFWFVVFLGAARLFARRRRA